MKKNKRVVKSDHKCMCDKYFVRYHMSLLIVELMQQNTQLDWAKGYNTSKYYKANFDCTNFAIPVLRSRRKKTN